MNNVLKNKYPYLSNFFSQIIKSSNINIANSLVFYGSDVLAQYYFALNIAKALNCQKSKEADCDCVNCNWIRSNKHPAVITISKIDNKTDDSKTVISKQQVDFVKDSLVNSSSYHRVFIFCDAEFKVLSEQEKNKIREFDELGICLPESNAEETGWFPKGLSRTCFQDVAANALLKSIEEPPENVTFIFLTEDKDDLIQTIISRSQCFFVPNFSKDNNDCEFLGDYLSEYPNLRMQNAIKFSKVLIEYQTKSEESPDYILDCIQEYLKRVLLANKDNKMVFYKTLKDIEKIEQSKKMLAAHMKESLVYEDLALYLFNQD